MLLMSAGEREVYVSSQPGFQVNGFGRRFEFFYPVHIKVQNRQLYSRLKAKNLKKLGLFGHNCTPIVEQKT